jgi:RNA polymerase sigma-70 factor (ECF subfamily)
LYGLAVNLVGNPADAEDVVQETLAGAFRGLRAFRHESSVKTWLTRILVRQAAHHHRRQRRYWPGGVIAQPAPERVAPSDQGRADLRMDVEIALAALSPEHRQVVLLRELEGMTYEQMAAVLAVPRGTIESRLFRARRHLQELLKEHLT